MIDADGDGDVSFDEFMTGIGMMKQHCMMPPEGSDENRGSVLGLRGALFEHRGNDSEDDGGQKGANDDHGGSRTLRIDGLIWLLRLCLCSC